MIKTYKNSTIKILGACDINYPSNKDEVIVQVEHAYGDNYIVEVIDKAYIVKDGGQKDERKENIRN